MNRMAWLVVITLAGCSSPHPQHLKAEGALGPYSASVSARGMVFVAGQIAPATDFANEAEGALRKVEAQLRRHGLGLGDVVTATVFLTDMDLYGPFNEVYGRVMPAPYPARACVAVAALPGGARVEVQVIASR